MSSYKILFVKNSYDYFPNVNELVGEKSKKLIIFSSKFSISLRIVTQVELLIFNVKDKD